MTFLNATNTPFGTNSVTHVATGSNVIAVSQQQNLTAIVPTITSIQTATSSVSNPGGLIPLTPTTIISFPFPLTRLKATNYVLPISEDNVSSDEYVLTVTSSSQTNTRSMYSSHKVESTGQLGGQSGAVLPHMYSTNTILGTSWAVCPILYPFPWIIKLKLIKPVTTM
ncbi:hypothetical protein JR316_0012073 [Psilocybe cubensis]|uniref:Uncharacterized protein n=1 Tax=Psilocybe cubensis TaxID=181762 RepID=A0ACB8GHK2_PSICU|nr:hypothetical protein JR316_0012073 [Psilocybe cubensis]KAH9474974.1 hypothetical protein JR316_0012073 [Psilocybe cubensis]